MIRDKEKILMLEKIKPFLQGDYRHYIDDEIKSLRPMKPEIEDIRDGSGDLFIVCPECRHIVCDSGEIEDWKEFYDFSEKPVVYCPMCRQAIDIDEIANKKTDCVSERKE